MSSDFFHLIGIYLLIAYGRISSDSGLEIWNRDGIKLQQTTLLVKTQLWIGFLIASSVAQLFSLESWSSDCWEKLQKSSRRIDQSGDQSKAWYSWIMMFITPLKWRKDKHSCIKLSYTIDLLFAHKAKASTWTVAGGWMECTSNFYSGMFSHTVNWTSFVCIVVMF